MRDSLTKFRKFEATPGYTEYIRVVIGYLMYYRTGTAQHVSV
eukprot:SAG31_NODE_28464_length_410_cov_0.604502_1_plen_41_part_10